MKQYLKYVPLVLFTIAIGKALIVNPGWSEVAVITVLGGLSFLFEYYSQSEEIIKLHDRCKNIDEICTHLVKENEHRKGDLSAVKLQGLKFPMMGK